VDSSPQDWLARWLTKTDRDLAVARNERAVHSESLVTEAICFHSQQAVEKLLKAYLIRHSIDFAKVHDLEYLRKLCASVDSAFADLELGDLSEYAVSIRYPGMPDEPSVSRADDALRIAEHVREFVRSRLD